MLEHVLRCLFFRKNNFTINYSSFIAMLLSLEAYEQVTMCAMKGSGVKSKFKSWLIFFSYGMHGGLLQEFQNEVKQLLTFINLEVIYI